MVKIDEYGTELKGNADVLIVEMCACVAHFMKAMTEAYDEEFAFEILEAAGKGGIEYMNGEHKKAANITGERLKLAIDNYAERKNGGEAK